MHDGTVRPRTLRISQRDEAYVRFLQALIQSCGGSAWTYREGRNRDLYVVEFSKSFLAEHRIQTRRDAIGYIRGYFDAEGGVPRSRSVVPYVYFAQKNRADLGQLRRFLLRLGVSCGRMHNPSRRRDPDYWRFFVNRRSHRRFAELVGSWHPEKAERLWMVI